MAKFIFSKFPREVTRELIQLSCKRIPTWSSVSGDRKVIKYLLINDGRALPQTLSLILSRVPVSIQTHPEGFFFRVDSTFRTYSGSSNNLPPVICVKFSRIDESASANCLLDTGSG